MNSSKTITVQIRWGNIVILMIMFLEHLISLLPCISLSFIAGPQHTHRQLQSLWCEFLGVSNFLLSLLPGHPPSIHSSLSPFFLRVLLCCPGWSSTPGLKKSSSLCLQESGTTSICHHAWLASLVFELLPIHQEKCWKITKRNQGMKILIWEERL